MELESFLSMFQRCFGYVTNDDSFATLVKEQSMPSVTLDTFRMGMSRCYCFAVACVTRSMQVTTWSSSRTVTESVAQEQHCHQRPFVRTSHTLK